MKKLYCSDWDNVEAETLVAEDPERVILELTESDKAKFDALPAGPSTESAMVTDQHTNVQFSVRRADCGANCFCAAHCEQILAPSGVSTQSSTK